MIGARLANRYDVVRELGRGGMGVVYLSRDSLLDRDVAIKLIAPGIFDESTYERFRREARVIARLDHPGIVSVHDFVAAESLLVPLFHPQNYCFARPEVEGFAVRRFFPSIPYPQLSLRNSTPA